MRTLLTQAFVFTADEDWHSFPDGALLIEDRRIAWVGPADTWETAGICADRCVPLGGAVVMPGLINCHAHGGLTLHRGACDRGGLFDWARVIGPHTSTLSTDDVALGCTIAIMEQIAGGTTCTCDCTRYGAGAFARAAVAAGLRSLSGALVNSPELRPQGRPDWPVALDETLEAQAELAGSGLARFYLGAHSPYNCTAERLLEVKRRADDLGMPFNIHVAETREEVARVQQAHGTTPVAWLDRLGVLDANTIIDHAVWVTPEEIEILARRRVRVAHCPISNAKLGSGIAPLPELLAAEVQVGLGTDSVLSNNSQDLWQEMKFAVLLQRAARADGSLLSSRDALRMVTLGAAEVLGWADEIGSLSVGKQADLVVLDLAHPLGLTPERVESDLVYACGPGRVRTVMVAGDVIYERGRYLRVDPAAVNARLAARMTAQGGPS